MTPNDVKTVAENINDFIEVPNGINRLRKAVLTLAMSGNLVPQVISEGTAEELYKKIQSEKKVLAGGRRKSFPIFMPLSNEEIPFDIPGTWKWVRICEIGLIVGGGTPSTIEKHYFTAPTEEGSIPWLSPADMRKQESMYISHGRQNLTVDGLKNSSATLMPKGAVIFSSRAPIGYVGIAINPLSTNQGFKSIIPAEGINSEYVYWYLRLRADDIDTRAPGTTFKEISGASFAKEVISLPPYLEQKRIVKKVEEVMKQLDELESKKKERDEIRTRLARSAMQSLGRGEPRIVFEELSELIKTPTDIKELEIAVLLLAASGKLESQNIEEGTGEDLYKKILVDLELKEKEWSSRRSSAKKLSSISSEKISFFIPKSWKWVRLDDLFLIERGGSPRPIESYITDDPEGLNWIKIGDTEKGGKYIYSTKEKILKSGLKKSRMVYKGDLLLTNSMSFGRPYILKIDGCIHDGWLVLRPYSKKIDIDLYYYLLSSSLFSKQFADLVSGAVVKNLNADKVKSAIVPLPPLNEQRRIVKKIEELMVLINLLKKVVDKE